MSTIDINLIETVLDVPLTASCRPEAVHLAKSMGKRPLPKVSSERRLEVAAGMYGQLTKDVLQRSTMTVRFGKLPVGAAFGRSGSIWLKSSKRRAVALVAFTAKGKPRPYGLRKVFDKKRQVVPLNLAFFVGATDLLTAPPALATPTSELPQE